MTTGSPSIEVHLSDDDLADQLAADVRQGLIATPKELPPRWFYDARGSDLFETITGLPEYYPTRCERQILAERATEIAVTTRATTLIELGSGSSTKTRLLLDALTTDATLRRYVPFDVCEAALWDASSAIDSAYPSLTVHAVVGDFEHHLHTLPRDGRTVVAFLGGTIGNLQPRARARFLRGLRSALEPGDWLLVGADLVKDPGRLRAAYDDSAGVTAQFNLNLLHVLNRELDADFDVERFDHVAVWNAELEHIEMRLRSTADQTVAMPALDMKVGFDKGEEMRTEISAKFRRSRIEQELAIGGFGLERFWTDTEGAFSLNLAVAS
jgi:L-histidine N-alpha-methyltransferase